MFKDRIIPNFDKLKALFFDFDGVLVDSVPIKTAAFKQLFQDQSPEIISKIEQHHLENGGISRFEKIKHYYQEFLRKPLSEEMFQALCDQFERLVQNAVIASPACPGAMEFLNENYQKCAFYVISGTPQDELRHIIHHRKMAHFFHDCLGAPVSKTQHIRTLMKTHNYHQDEVLFVGDAMSDFKATLETQILFVSV